MATPNPPKVRRPLYNYPDKYAALIRQGFDEAQTDRKVRQLLPVLNQKLPGYSRVSEIEIKPDEFEHTPKHSIRRFIYK